MRGRAAIALLLMAVGLAACSSGPRSLTPDEFEVGVAQSVTGGEPEIGIAVKYNLRERAREMGR